jgi:hypothetical protein
MKVRDILPHERSEDNMVMAHRRLLVAGPAHYVASEADTIRKKAKNLNKRDLIARWIEILLTCMARSKPK